MLLDQETHDLQLRVLDLEVRIAEAEARLRGLSEAFDRVVAFLRQAHGDEFTNGLARIEQAAQDVLRP
jgi:hypothetical protein